AFSAERWAAMITKAWERPLVSLTDAVYWIAAGGKPYEPDDGDLEAAAGALVDKLQAGEGKALGMPPRGETHKPIPVEDIFSATAHGAEFYGLNLSVPPALMWAHLPGEDRDHIIGAIGDLWSRIAVRREDLKRLPLAIGKVGRPPLYDWSE